MATRLSIPPRGIAARIADRIAYPVMCLPLFTPWGESPQLTHFWNNIKLPLSSTDELDPGFMVTCDGDPYAVVRRSRIDIRFHLGGWSKYVVLLPSEWRDDWYVGWITANSAGVSRIPIKRGVRMLIGPEETAFFAVRTSDCEQIRINLVGKGELGDGSVFGYVPLH